MTVLMFPKQSLTRAARLENDERRLLAWYEPLLFADPWAMGGAWFTLHELRAATGIPLTRLPTVLYRQRWFTRRKRGYPGVVFWHGPACNDPLEEP
jgi:hypothetical protein